MHCAGKYDDDGDNICDDEFVSGYDQNEDKSRKYDSGDEGNQVVILILITLDSVTHCDDEYANMILMMRDIIRIII